MEELNTLRRGASETSSTQSRKRRASAITARIQRSPTPSGQPREDPTRTRNHRAAGCLLIVQDPAEEHEFVVMAARLAGLQVLQAKSREEAVQILLERSFPVDLLLVIDHPSLSSSAANLIRKSLEIRPGLHVLMMMDSGQPETMRAGYDAGAASIILHGMPSEALTTFLQQSLSAAREGQRQEVERRKRRARYGDDSLARRGLRKVRLAATAMGAAAFLFGIGLAFVVERSYLAGDQAEATMNRLLERMNRSRSSTPATEAAILYRQNLEQIGLTREANEATRRYHQEHLQELRWQNHSRSSTPSEQVTRPSPDGNGRLRQ
jgi:DNA-binding NarL/FixJ family response regulator